MAYKTSKKAQVDIQFNWIFVMIAGFLILLFFIGIVVKQKDLSKMEISSSKATELRGIITSSQVSTDTKNAIDLPDISIEFVCDSKDVSQFRVQGAASINLPTEPVFSPDLVQGEKIILKAVEFSAPFKITNLLFLSSPDIRYIFVFDQNTADDFALSLYNKMPADIYKEKISYSQLSNLKDNKNYKVKFIFFDISKDLIPKIPEKLDSMSNKDISAVSVSGTGSKIDFFKKQGSSFVYDGSSFYLDDSMIYGSIFSESRESYECNMRKVFKRFAFVASVYAERKKAFEFGDCISYYGDSIQSLKEKVIPCASDISACIGLLPDIQAVKANNLMLKQKSCPLIY